MTIKEVHDYILMVLKKENGGYVAHEEIDQALDAAQMGKFTELFGNVKQYQPGRPVPPVSYAVTQRIHDDLRNFKVRNILSTTNTLLGQVPLPSDYLHFLGMSMVYSEAGIKFSSIKILDESELIGRLNSQLLAPNRAKPFGVIFNSYIQVWPATPFAGELNYLKRPDKPSYQYTITGRLETYDPLTSVDLKWSDDCQYDIINKALVILGLRLSDESVMAISQSKDQTGA
jgi:hypothetical protein